MSAADDFAARMYAAATPQDRGERVPGVEQAPAATTAATKPGAPPAATQAATASTLASRMYPAKPVTTSPPPPAARAGLVMPPTGNATQAAGTSSPDKLPPVSDAQVDQMIRDGWFTPEAAELVAREVPIEERMEEAAAIRPETPEGYAHTIDPGFDALEQIARDEHNAADIAALAEGRQAAQALLHELAVPTRQAKDVVAALSGWHTRELTDEQVEDLGDRAVAELRAEWGKDYDAKLAIAKRTASEATRRAPWLQDLWRTGAGNDPALIRHFAQIGLRNARRARGKK